MSSACLVQVAVISFRYFAWGSPSFFCSAMATDTFPASSTTCPSASRRASRPATRTAEGPISTPRRDWPRSSGTPMTRIFRGVMLEKDGVMFVIETYFRESPQLPIFNFRFTTQSSIDNCESQILRIEPVQHSRKWNRLPNMLQPANPSHCPFDPHAKARVRHAAVFPQVEIPLECLFRQTVFVNALE